MSKNKKVNISDKELVKLLSAYKRIQDKEMRHILLSRIEAIATSFDLHEES